ncbi:hypothetical protein [Desulforhabdus sp. TSK]|uniref:hypothetical protein n=1 Tax=Desulforhabdus sp. TSK TaxID=2925014 RepID=UPI001FC88F43|nr:hypothetical protein [Desulforhabdus sp. TSK]GKT07638.1 hypothetical protein DSTSK_09430 [Desulforhabdus sp. TSK]
MAANKVKPCLVWKMGGSFNPFPFDDDAWEHMAEILQLPSIEDNFKLRITDAYHSFVMFATVDARPRLTQKRAMLDVSFRQGRV